MKTHGMCHTRIYRCWNSMNNRCKNSSHKYYSHYGGRGITVCNEWKKFIPFYEWAIANGYADNLSIDRIDNDKGYYPENCRWATPKQQSENRNNYKWSYKETRGISRTPNGKYRAKVYSNKKWFHVGCYLTFEDAKQAREEFVRKNDL